MVAITRKWGPLEEEPKTVLQETMDILLGVYEPLQYQLRRSENFPIAITPLSGRGCSMVAIAENDMKTGNAQINDLVT